MMLLRVEFWDEILVRGGGECKTLESLNFLRKGEMVILVKNSEFF